MRICIIGKFPPIQGGVSMRTYWTAHRLAERGHDVHVVTNAKETHSPYRMYMRPADWERCAAVYGGGSVTVHWTDPVDESQSYIPMASPFVSKLAATAAGVHSSFSFDVVLSHYLEPYGVAGHLVAEMTGAPHVVRMAGSDAGRLWRHPQLELLYDHVLRSAEVVIAAGVVAQRAIKRGVDPQRIAADVGFRVSEDLFSPDGPKLDLAALRREIAQDPDFRDLAWGDFAADRPYFGICGKLGEKKGSFALLAAMRDLERAGLEVGLVALAHRGSAIQRRFRAQAVKFGIADRILQLPFLPHWRVPSFLRSCLAVCCLEQDFPIGFHSPIIPREALLCGSCLVASTEVIRKLPGYERLPHGYGCIAIENVNDVEILAKRLAAIVNDPRPVAAVGARGRSFALELQRELAFPQRIEAILQAASERRGVRAMHGSGRPDSDVADHHFCLTQMGAATLGETGADRHFGGFPISTVQDARGVLAGLETRVMEGNANLQTLVAAVRTEIAVATAEGDAGDASGAGRWDPLFRLSIRRWAMDDGDLAELVPVRDPQVRILEFNFDVSQFAGVQTVAELPAELTKHPSWMVVFGSAGDGRRSPMLVDGLTARILELSDGTRTVAEIAVKLNGGESDMESGHLSWIENLFRCGLLSLEDSRSDAPSSTPADVDAAS